MGNLFGFISHPMELGLIWLASIIGNAGIGIIVFTIIVRLVLSPLQIVQLRNSKAMQRIQPLVKELQKKHGKDRQAQAAALSALYKEHNVNPAMGCLPTLLQFPILIGLFYALLHLGMAPHGYPKAIIWAQSACNGHAVHSWTQWFSTCYAVSGSAHSAAMVWNLFHAKFLWLNTGLGLPDPYYILPVLAGLSQWVQSRMMLTRTADPQQQMMNSMMNFMPLMIVIFALRYPSGLSLYWVTSTLIGILIQYRITGLGLLAELPSPATLFSSGRQTASSSGNKNRRPASLPNTAPAPAPHAEPNGHDDTGESPSKASQPVRQRRKANRARGGKGGGRRG